MAKAQNDPYPDATYAIHNGEFGDDVCGVMYSYSTNCWLEPWHEEDHESRFGFKWMNDPPPSEENYQGMENFQKFINDYWAWLDRHPEFDEMGG